jgi:hypothetical protein
LSFTFSLDVVDFLRLFEVLREIPFSLIEFPLWEALKRAVVSHRKQRRRTTNGQSRMANAVSLRVYL